MTSQSREVETVAFEPGMALKLRHFAANHVLLVIGAVLFGVIVSGALFAPWIATHDPLAIVL